ncbi:MAG: hypothetical protein ACP5GS_05930 [Nitrososphaeria archaeon]
MDLKVISKKKNYEEVMAESCMGDLALSSGSITVLMSWLGT